MITQPESGLSVSQYEALRDGYGDPTLRLTAEQYSPSFTFHDTDGVGANTTYDACVCGTHLVRAARTAVDTISVQTLANEDAGDQAWTALVNLNAPGVDADCPITVVGDIDGGGPNTTVRIFYSDAVGQEIRYFENAAEGVGNAGTWAGPIFILDYSIFGPVVPYLMAASVISRLHLWWREADSSRGLTLVEEPVGTWLLSDYLWLPFTATSFDAVEGNQVLDSSNTPNDILVLSIPRPPILGVKTEGVTVTHTVEPVEGLVFYQWSNKWISSPFPFDVVDRMPLEGPRRDVKLSKVPSISDFLFCAYTRIDGGPSTHASEDFAHYGWAVTRSKCGNYFEMPYILPTLTDIDGNKPGALLPRGEHLYLVADDYTYRSPGVSYSENCSVILDLTNYALQVSTNHQDVQEIQVVLSNPAGILDTMSPLGDDVEMQLRLKLGYSVGGEDLVVQTGLFDAQVMGTDETLPANHLAISGRDCLARMTSFWADQIYEREGACVGGDDFEGSVSEYSGLIHTAGQNGVWKTTVGELYLETPNQLGTATNTYIFDSIDGTMQTEFQFDDDADGNVAGLVCRYLDKDNFVGIYYDAVQDKIVVSYFTGGVETEVEGTCDGVLGFFPNIWYGMYVVYHGSTIMVATSTDGLYWTWCEWGGGGNNTLVIGGMHSIAQWTWNDYQNVSLPPTSGRCGFMGYWIQVSGGGE